MVSIKTTLTLAALAVGVVLFFGAGGFKGVGQKIGGFFGQGFSDFSSSLSGAFTGGLFGGNAGASSVGSAEGTNTQSTNTVDQALDLVNPISNQLGIFQTILDSLKNIGNFGQNAFGSGITPSQARTTAFAFQNLRAGQTASDLIIKPRQGTAVSRTGMSFVTNIGGRERAFGSAESRDSFIERFNR